ncbi:ArsR/SmtB family transcription factor [Aquilutibacter rugosus]|uniref:ArsR/SmtB family transcription factor n=1 Tax=Aquilutibacter rugosus TaxID=3115820 RepID=UPI002F4022DA
MEMIAASQALGALGHTTRLMIYRLLVQAGPNGMLAGDIGADLVIPGGTLTFHLKELVRTGLISAEAKGRTMRYRADYEVMSGLLNYLTENCCAATAARQQLNSVRQPAAAATPETECSNE